MTIKRQTSKPISAKMAEHLSRWYIKNHRVLPWRQTLDPYSIWISEVMLQQTQVITVLGYYETFLKRFPTLKALANSSLEDVLTYWKGLGYYSRARSLHKGAKYLIENGGNFPKTRDALLKVPGIGPYTAGAVLSISFNLPEPIVDGNVARVVTRYFAWKPVLECKETQEFLWRRADEFVKTAKEPRIFNQALMELGATICTKAQPKCHLCPIQIGCKAFQQNAPTLYPFRRPRTKTKELFWVLLLQKQKDRLWMTKNLKGSWWQDLWDFPRIELSKSQWKNREIFLKKSLNVATLSPLNLHKHTVTHHKITVAPYVIEQNSTHPLFGTKKGKWIKRIEISNIPSSSLTRKVLDAI